jgi:SpoVK/Ycf46/Vps4 family AAA+-type ATPase
MAIQSTKKNSSGMFTDAINSLTDETSKEVRDLAERIERLLKTIDSKLKRVSLEDTRRRFNELFYHKEKGLDSLVGRDDIKDYLALRLDVFAKNPRVFFSGFQNMLLMGGPGLGKTRVATVIGHVYACAGILIESHVFVVTSEALVSMYVSATSNKTRSFLLSTLESVTFIDEAYGITPEKNLWGTQVNHGQDAITEMVNFIDKFKGLNVIIAAGYENELRERFLKANEGMDRRFPAVNQIVLQPYSSKELSQILLDNLQSTAKDITFSPHVGNFIYSLIDDVYTKNKAVFKNQAGDMINLASELAHMIYSNDDQWGTNPEGILLSGFNRYLKSKDIAVFQEKKIYT